MGTLTGLLLGAGVVSIWWACCQPRPSRQPSRWSLAMTDRLIQAGVHHVSPSAFAGVCLAIAAVMFLLAWATTTSVAIAFAFAILAGALPGWYIQYRAQRRRRDLRELWPDVVDDLISAIRAGMSLPEAVVALADRGPEELQQDFAAFAADYRATGRFTDALDRLKDRLADPVADRIIEALRLTRQVGGSELSRLLRTLSQFLREDLRTRAELTARQSWTVNGARLAAVAPWIVLGLLATRTDTAQAFDTPIGALILVAGAGLTIIAYALMVRLGRLPDDVRVLR